MVPISRQVAVQLAEPPEGVDRSLWLYELCRFLTMKVNNLIIAFFAESPPCSSQTCPEMRASEWQYLCAVHDPPKSCCAIDYCCHTLDWATNTLTSPKYFPSRLTLGSDASGGPQASMRHLTNIFRRLYRIFAHAWFQHRDVFWEVEGHDGLYVFFKTVCDRFSLIPEDNYTIPPEAEGVDAVQLQAEEPVESKRLTILRKDIEKPFGDVEGLDPSISTGATTRRHKHSPSTGSRVTTITESAEDSEEAPQQSAPLRDVLKTSPEPRPPSAVENHVEPQSALVEPSEPTDDNEPVESAEPATEEQQTEPEPESKSDTEPEQQSSDPPVNPEPEQTKQSESQADANPAQPDETLQQSEGATTPSAAEENKELTTPELEAEAKADA